MFYTKRGRIQYLIMNKKTRQDKTVYLNQKAKAHMVKNT